MRAEPSRAEPSRAEPSRAEPSLRCAWLLPLILLAAPLSHADLTTTEAFSLGQGDGSAGTGAASGSISGANAQTNLPYYGTSAPESSLFAGGQGSLFGPSVGKIDGCKAGYTGTDQPGKQECDAINFLFKNVQERPQITVSKADPALVASHLTIKSASTQVGTLPGMEGNYSACVTRTETIPGDFTTETCADYQSASQNVCSMGQEVVVEGGQNYQCDKTQQTVQPSSCNKNLGVTVTGSVVSTLPSPIYFQHIQPTVYNWITGSITSLGSSIYRVSINQTNVQYGAYVNNPYTFSVYGDGQLLAQKSCSTGSICAFDFNVPSSFSVFTYSTTFTKSPYFYASKTWVGTSHCGYLPGSVTCPGGPFYACSGVTGCGRYLTDMSIPRIYSMQTSTLVINKSWDNQCATLESRSQ